MKLNKPGMPEIWTVICLVTLIMVATMPMALAKSPILSAFTTLDTVMGEVNRIVHELNFESSERELEAARGRVDEQRGKPNEWMALVEEAAHAVILAVHEKWSEEQER